MPKNQTGGSRHKKGANSAKRFVVYADGRETIYAQVTAKLGGSQFTVHCQDDVNRTGVVRGSVGKGGNNYVRPGDYVLVGLRTYLSNQTTCDIVFRYNPDEVEGIRAQGRLVYTTTQRPFGAIQTKTNEDAFQIEFRADTTAPVVPDQPEVDEEDVDSFDSDDIDEI